jgi:hypothetical protein
VVDTAIEVVEVEEVQVSNDTCEGLLIELMEIVDVEALPIEYPVYIAGIPDFEVQEYARKHYRESKSLSARIQNYLRG